MKKIYNTTKQMFVRGAENIDHNKTVFGCGLAMVSVYGSHGSHRGQTSESHRQQ